MTTPAGYSARHSCTLPKLTAKMMAADPGRVETCAGTPSCGRVWTSTWNRDVGGESQPQWVSYPQVMDLLTRVTALEARTVALYAARAAVTALAVNGTITLPLTWNGTFPDPVYTIGVLPAAALLGKVTWTEVANTRTRTGVSIKLTATAAVLVASDVIVTATRYA